MPLNIRNEEVNQLAETLARRKHMNKTDVVKFALEAELRRMDEGLSLIERLKPLQDRIACYGLTGLKADKAFYDSLNDE